MKVDSKKPVVVVGAGITGMTLAWLLAEKDIPVIVIEKLQKAGGLARSFRYDDFTFDIGPHRFHTAVPHVNSFIKDTLGKDALVIPRKSLVRFKGHFYPWPLHPSYVLLKFPPFIALAVLRDLFTLFRKKKAVSFRDHIVNMYGNTLYRHFFQGYSTKFLGITPELTHQDWAKTGIDRAIIDERLEIKNLWQLILSVLRPKAKTEMDFLYPKGGCDKFIDLLMGKFLEKGGEALLGQTIDSVEIHKGEVKKIRIGEREIEPSMVVWTGTIHSLLDLLNVPTSDLKYLALVCYNIMLTDGQPFNFQWSYHNAPDTLFSRVSVPANFDTGNTPKGKRSICVEVTCREEDKIFTEPDQYVERILVDMERESLLDSDKEVISLKAEPVRWAYPIYQLDYRELIKQVDDSLKPFSNIVRAGRLGQFWYNNMDHCIEEAFSLTDKILNDQA